MDRDNLFRCVFNFRNIKSLWLGIKNNKTNKKISKIKKPARVHAGG
jgi:hypothetical protein